MSDSIHHPRHYSTGRFGVECIAFTRHMACCPANSFKYVFRHQEKNGLEDLRKAAVYLPWAIEDRRMYAQGAALPGRTGLLIELAHKYVKPNADGVYWALMDIVHSRFDDALTRIEDTIRDMECAA